MVRGVAETLELGVEPPSAPRTSSDHERFLVEAEGAGPLTCREVRGFHAALYAAYDPQASLPQRLVVGGADPALADWLFEWAQDETRVRRTVTVHRRLDEKCVTAVLTLASFGPGVETSLAVESVTLAWESGFDPMLRSGIHERVSLDF